MAATFVVGAVLAAAPLGQAAAVAPQSTPRPAAKAADRPVDPAVLLARAAPGVRAKPEHYVVTIADGFDSADVLADFGRRVKPIRRFTQVMDGFSVRTDAATATALANDPRVVLVEPDWLLKTEDVQANPPWGIDRIDQRDRPLTDTYTYRSAGRGVRVYVVDSGVFAGHRDFGDRVVRGFDALGRGSTDDCVGHGTHVAGTIAGRRFGVAKAATIVPVRAGCDWLTTSNIVAALDFVVRDHRAGQPAVANMSLGGGPSRTLDAAVRRVIADGVTVVVAAGNESQNACYTSPARVGGAITVGASNRFDQVADFSNRGRCVDVFAPGVDVRSASRRSRTASVVHEGTSMASPHVAGVAARILGERRKASPATVGTTIRSSAGTGVLRNRWYGDPDRLVRLLGRSRTRLSVQATSSTIQGQVLQVSGTLRDAVSGVPLSRGKVRAYYRRAGTSRWNQVGAGVTGRGGGVAIGVVMSATGDLQLRHPGALDSARAASGTTRARITRPVGNDMFSSARSLTLRESATVTASSTLATKEIGEPNHGGNRGGKSVWWTVSPATSGMLTLSTQGSGFDTLLGVYRGGSVSSLTRVASSDDVSGARWSRVTVRVTGGTTYRVAVDGYSGRSGSITLGSAWTPAPPPPANDAFAAAAKFTLTEGLVMQGTNVRATKESGEPNHASVRGGKSVWWRFTAPADGRVVLSTQGSTFDTLLGVYRGGAVGSLARVASSDDYAGSSSRVSFAVASGVTYSVAVDGYSGASGAVTLAVGWTPAASPPVNDTFASATTFSLGASGQTGLLEGSNVSATRESGEPTHAGGSGGKSVWWRFTPTSSGTVTLWTEGSTFDTLLGVYTGSTVGLLGAVAANDDDDDGGLSSLVTFQVTSGVTYHVAVDGYHAGTGSVALHFTWTP